VILSLPLWATGGLHGQEADGGKAQAREMWHALNLLSRESKTFQELADEAFRDQLHKYGRPTDLKAALRESARSPAGPGAASRKRHPRER
jgi:hypothetical protein